MTKSHRLCIKCVCNKCPPMIKYGQCEFCEDCEIKVIPQTKCFILEEIKNMPVY